MNVANWNGRRCLVTGAGGFIGTSLCRHLTYAGADVWGMGRSSGGPQNVRWVSCDVTDRSGVEETMRAIRPDVVFHLASVVMGARRLDLVVPTLQSNLTGFVNVVIAAGSLQCKKIIGMGSLQEPDQILPATPSSPYAAAKYAASCYARMFVDVFDFPIAIARPLMVYGPNQSDLTKLVPHVLSNLLARRKAPLSRGIHPFDWVYIDDVCDALLAIADCERAIGRTVDIGTGVLTPVIDVARGLAQRLNATDLLEVGVIPDRVGEPVRAADVAATKTLTGWQANVGLEQGLDLTVAWFAKHASGPPNRCGMV